MFSKIYFSKICTDDFEEVKEGRILQLRVKYWYQLTVDRFSQTPPEQFINDPTGSLISHPGVGHNKGLPCGWNYWIC